MKFFINQISCSVKSDKKLLDYKNNPKWSSISINDDVKRVSKKRLYCFESTENQIEIIKRLTLYKKCPVKNIVFLNQQKERFWSDFINNFKLVLAGGGLVRKENELLLIFRNKYWDLPKGKLEKGEKINDCALREVEEETGVKAQLGNYFLSSYHTYYRNEKFCLKQSTWYEMNLINENNLAPQLEEGIDEVIWCPIKDLSNYQEKSFSAINWLLQKYINSVNN